MKNQAVVREFLSPVKKVRVIEEILDKMRALWIRGSWRKVPSCLPNATYARCFR